MRSPQTTLRLPASKVCNLQGDAGLLAADYQTLDRVPEILAGQHQIRQWEYGMALHVIRDWVTEQVTAGTLTDPPTLMDVGGASSHFWQVLTGITPEDVIVVDPGLQEMGVTGQVTVYPGSVEQLAATGRHGYVGAITAISVVEHVEEVRAFFRACHMLLQPGGLLFLTMDYWDAEGEDLAHFHWMRRRIYNADRVRKLAGDLRELGFKSYGQADWQYHGPQVYDYSVASLAMVKR